MYIYVICEGQPVRITLEYELDITRYDIYGENPNGEDDCDIRVYNIPSTSEPHLFVVVTHTFSTKPTILDVLDELVNRDYIPNDYEFGEIWSDDNESVELGYMENNIVTMKIQPGPNDFPDTFTNWVKNVHRFEIGY